MSAKRQEKFYLNKALIFLMTLFLMTIVGRAGSIHLIEPSIISCSYLTLDLVRL